METGNYGDIFSYIKTQESAYKQPIPLNGAWNWSMTDHIKTSFLYKNSQLLTGKNDFKPVKNITRPILNLQYRAEDIDVKDVLLYADDKNKYHLSFLVKKYHDDVFVQEYDLDSYFDELNESRVDFGAGLSKSLNKPCPEVVPLQSIAFCDQTDMLSGPIGIKHYYSPDQLLDMGKRGWGNKANGATSTLKKLIELSKEEKRDNNTDGAKAQTPGRYIEIYEVHGNLPKRFADKTDDSEEYETRLFIVAFYQNTTGDGSTGVILYTAPEAESPFKIIKRDPVFGRALGFGGAEELFEPQVWVNYDMIRMQAMLDAASKTILSSTDPAVAQRNNVRDMDNLEIVELAPDRELKQVDTFPRNLRLFDNSVQQWEAHAQQMGAANDALMGKPPTSGTPFKLQELVTQEGQSLHDYRRGKFAKHLEEVYRDWIIPHIEKKICEGATFLSELSLDELKYVTDSVVTCEMEKMKKDYVLSHGGMAMLPEEEAMLEQKIRMEFKKKGTKHFIEVLKGEFKGVSLGVKINIAGKQRNLGKAADTLSNIFRQAFASPQGFAMTMQIPGMAAAFNSMLEYAGISPVDFSNVDQLKVPAQSGAPQSAQEGQGQPSPIQPQQQPAAY